MCLLLCFGFYDCFTCWIYVYSFWYASIFITIGIDDFVGFCFNISKVSNNTYELLYCLANLITNTTTMAKLHEKFLERVKDKPHNQYKSIMLA